LSRFLAIAVPILPIPMNPTSMSISPYADVSRPARRSTGQYDEIAPIQISELH
jgi:hypothetical protein